MPPWIFGCRVFTRPSIISGKPVCADTSRTGTPAPEVPVSTPGGEQIHSLLSERTSESRDTGFVGNAEQRPPHLAFWELLISVIDTFCSQLLFVAPASAGQALCARLFKPPARASAHRSVPAGPTSSMSLLKLRTSARRQSSSASSVSFSKYHCTCLRMTRTPASP